MIKKWQFDARVMDNKDVLFGQVEKIKLARKQNRIYSRFRLQI
jgi:hypothetical protein